MPRFSLSSSLCCLSLLPELVSGFGGLSGTAPLFVGGCSYIITRVAPHCVSTLRILHAAYDATKETCSLYSLSLGFISYNTSLSSRLQYTSILYL